jgi:hypothetical protein
VNDDLLDDDPVDDFISRDLSVWTTTAREKVFAGLVAAAIIAIVACLLLS